MNNWVTIQTYMYPQEASIAQAKLESMGIDTFLENEFTAQVVNVYSNAVGGVNLQVPKDKGEEAISILIEGGLIITDKKKLSPQIEVLNIADQKDPTKCPFCRSDNIDNVVHPNILVILFYFVLGIMFPIFKTWEKCYDCEKEWKYKKLKNEGVHTK